MGTSKHHKTQDLVGNLLRAESKEIAVVLTYGLGVGILSLAVPIGVQALVNNVTFGSLSQPLLFLVIAVFGGLAVAAIFRTIQVIVVEKIQVRFFAYTSLELSARLPRVRIDRLAGARFPELVNRFFDVLTVQKTISSLLIEGFALILQTLIGLVLLGFYHPVLLAFDFLLVLAMVAILFWLGRGAVGTAIEESVQKYRVAAWLEEVAGRSESFRSAEARRFALRRTDDLVVGYLAARREHFKIILRQVIGSVGLQAFASAALLGVGAYLVVREQLTLGQLIAAEIVVTNVLSSLTKFQKHLEAFYDLAAALEKIEVLMDLPLEEETTSTRLEKSGPAALSFQGLAFRRQDSSFQLAPLSREFPAGHRVALQGSKGSGKSTLVDLLYGLKAPSQGTLLIDGVDYRELGLEELRRHVTLVRDIDIVSGSILDNVVFGRKDVTPALAKEALRKVGVLDDFLQLKDGVNTQLTDNGAPLSVGYAQLLVLARAIAASPRLLVVDEMVDGLDPQTRDAVLKVLLDRSAPWTLILSTQDPDVAKRFDEVLELGTQTNGRVA
jgi:ABC-type bacteriocin/lantibiotic exporter with double-glycine peptidase domain